MYGAPSEECKFDPGASKDDELDRSLLFSTTEKDQVDAEKADL